MITRITLEEKSLISNMVKNLAHRWANRLEVSEEILYTTLNEASVEIYQEKPFTTTVIRKTVNGKQIRGLGFTKYNLNDIKFGQRYAWTDTKGKIMSLNRAYRNFIDMMMKEKVFSSLKTKRQKLNVQVIIGTESIKAIN